MNCNLELLKQKMPPIVRDTDYINHILIHQNDEIIRLLKKLAGEKEVVLPVQEVVPLQTLVEEPKVEMLSVEKKVTKRKKKEV